MKSLQLITIISLFPEPPSDPEILGVNEPIIVGKQPEVICHVERAKPSNLTIRWNIAGDHRVLNAKLSVTPANGDGVVSAHSVLLYNFTRDDDRRNLQCDVIPGVDQALNTRTTDEVLSLECELQETVLYHLLYDHTQMHGLV